jgi:hypothetical protein
MDDSGNTKQHDQSAMVLCGGFLFLNSTATTKALWRDLVEVHKVQMGLVPWEPRHAHAISPDQSIEHITKNINWGNEQSTFIALVRHSRTVSLAWLPYEEFKSGQWLVEGKINLQTLKIVHSNFLIGMERKVDALKRSHLWFVGDERCRAKGTKP